MNIPDDYDDINVNCGEFAEMVSVYLNRFKVSHSKSLSDFNRVCFEVVARVLWRYNKYGFYKENLNK